MIDGGGFFTTNESPNVAIRWEWLRLIASAVPPRRPLIADGDGLGS
jgi:hypothetical protein